MAPPTPGARNAACLPLQPVARMPDVNYNKKTQLLLGDRATRKHAKNSLNGRGNDNLG